ncbi:MAG: hypothetical protein ACE37K_10170 [Planctomycetota bacterium]
MPKPFPLLLVGAALAGAAVAQEDTRRLEIDSTLTRDLASFARSAASQKAYTLAREVAQLVIDHYDADSNTARRVLGQRKVRGSWQSDGKPRPDDAVQRRREQSLERKWKQLRQKAGQMHKHYALALVDENAPKEQRTAELEMALRYLPNDAALHRALGHQEVNGFWGTAEDVAFVSRMLAIRDKADELSTLQVDVKEVPNGEMPIELKNMGMPMFGARSENYTYWTNDGFEASARLCTWSERCHAFLQHLLGPKKDAVRGAAWKWHLVLRTAEQRDALLQKSPTTRGPFTFEQARLFAGIGFRCEEGGRASATWHEQPLDADHAVANVTKRHLLDQRNEGLGEGLTHVTTWLLCGSTHTYFADLPKTVTAGELMPRDPDRWIERLWDEIDQGKDMPLVVVPRERADNFRDSTRLKTWSFMCWMLARHPDKWLPLIDACGAPKITPEGVEAAFQDVLGQPLGEIEQQWRAWARRGSKLGKASHWGQK